MPSGIYERKTKKHISEIARKHMGDATKRRWQNGENLLKKAHLMNKLRNEINAIFIICQVCFTRRRASPRSKNAKYCSMKCYGISKRNKPLSEKHKLALRQTTYRQEHHWNWKGGVKTRWPEKEYSEWRISIFKRDQYQCQECRTTKTYLEAHHIKRKIDYPALVYNINNGITLCTACHKHTYGKEKLFEHKYLKFINTSI